MVLAFYLLQVFIAKEMIPVSGSATISVPSAGNCGDDTVLTCYVTENIGITSWNNMDRTLAIDGVPARPEDNNKYTETKGISSFKLTIHNTGMSDGGMYKCQNGFTQSTQKSLKIECKASAAVMTVQNSKKVVISVDKLYPASPTPTLAVSFKKENSAITAPGSRTCYSSTQYTGYYRCVWTSSNSLTEGSYTYRLVVTTITQADPLTGSFELVSPQTPILSNVKEGEDRLYANEGQAVTIQCISRGGYPVPTVALYKDTISGDQMASIGTGTLQSDNTYTVTLQHTFNVSTSYDRKALICRSYYPQADSSYKDSKTKSVVLYLNLKPSQPTVTQTSHVSTGDTVEVICRTTGCRPAANISWSYQGSKTTAVVSSTEDVATETFTVVSVFKRKVTAADNGQSVHCIVTHIALINPSEKTEALNLNVRFPVGASSTKITGNIEMIATGTAALTLTCTTGSSNPASDIKWKNGSALLTSNRPYINSTGENKGVVRSQQLLLYPTRYMDDDVITCTVSNAVSQSDVVDDATLNLKYSPLVNIQDNPQITVTEGDSKQLSCSVNSKPSSTITWYHGNSVEQQGTLVNNVLNYNLTPVNRTHAGTYSCKANNGIGPEKEDQISVIVRFKSLTTTINGNSTIIANGRDTLSLLCTSGSSNPISDITWRLNNVVTASTETLTDISGDYGGMKRRRRLILTPSRNNDGDVISCEAHNNIGTSERSTVTLDLRYRPMINSMQDVTVVEGNYTILTCTASSKPASTFTWYKEGQSSSLKEGTGTLENNKLSYTINNVRRTDAAIYKCDADNGIETADSKNLNLTVNFPPIVTVDASNTTIKETSTILTCNAAGIPNKNYQYGKWIQTWPGYPTPLSKNTGNKKLELTGLTYENSGIYTCSASNGIKVFDTNNEFMEGSAYLLVKSFPIITRFDEKVPAKLEENTTMEVYFYSNAAGSDVKIEIERNGSKPHSLKYSESTTPEQVDLKVFSHNIKTDGTRAQILIQLQSKEDLGYYDVVVSNEIDSSRRSFEIVPQGPPFKPYNMSVFDIQPDKVSLSWIRGYHGGFAQTFVIQYSIDLNNWKNITFDGGKDESEEPITGLVSGLQASTMYYVRMYAFNKEGNSKYTETLNYTTTSLPDDGSGPSSSAIIGGAAGGGLAIVLIVVVVVAVVFLKRRGYLRKGKSPADDCKSDRRPVYTDENEYGMQDNPMYETAGPRNAGHTVGASGSGDMGAVYSTVDKKKLVETNKNDVYAEVDKSKKTKANTDVEYSSPVKPKGKDKKEKTKHGFMKDKKGKKAAKEGDLYENANELKGVATTKKNDETIYENPEPSKAGKKKNVNKDGLIYADLTFNDQPKGQKKLVIHGLDSMTEYVEVDFTKKADPLPDSDDENNSTTK